MPAIWPTFIGTVGGFLNAAVEKTHKDTANMIATQYDIAVSTANTSLHANIVMNTIPPSAIEIGILKTLDDIRESEGKPKLSHFTDWANATSAYWLSAIMSPVPFHPANMAASTGTVGIPVPITHIINNGGVIPALANDLLTAFSDGPQKIPYGIPFATKLVTAFTNHLSTVGGLQTEFVTAGSPITPIPIGPIPAPWVGMV